MGNKKKAAKFISVLLTLIMFIGIFMPAASAYEEEKLPDPVVETVDFVYSNHGLELKSFMNRIDFAGLKKYLVEKLADCPNDVDISKFNISVNDFSELLHIITLYMPELFHVYFCGFSYTENYLTRKIRKLEIYDYPYDSATYKQKLEVCKKAGDKLLYGIEGNTTMSDCEKALLIHDRLANYCAYAKDQTSLELSLRRKNIYTLEGALVERSTVCNGYALAYRYLAERAGLEAYYCSSELLNHAWNIVYVDGIPYHLDSTWDDPTWDQFGQVCHYYALQSTEKFKRSHHKDGNIDYDTTPTDTRYDNAFWYSNDIVSQFVYIDGKYYYIEGEFPGYNRIKLKSTSTFLDTNDDIVLDAATPYLNEILYASDGEFISAYSSTRLQTDGKNLYFNGAKCIYKYDLSTNTVSEFYRPGKVNESETTYIYGFYYDGKEMLANIVDLGNTYNGQTIGESKESYTVLNSSCTADIHSVKVTAPAKEATCAYEGNTEEGYCIVCGKTFAKTVLPKTEHNYGDWVITSNSTCSKAGKKTKTCSKCGGTINESLPLTEHIWEWVIDKNETCGANGVKHQKCKNCSATQNKNTSIPATGEHSWIWVTGREPTCTADGERHEQCTVCKATRNTGNVIPATGIHKWTTVVEAAADCIHNGKSHEECAYCGIRQNENTVIPANGIHDYTWIIDKEATCTETGLKHQKCKVCGTETGQNTVVGTNGNHTYNGETCIKCGHKCSCTCHKDGFMGFIWKIQKFFYKLFNNNKTCTCGNPHW